MWHKSFIFVSSLVLRCKNKQQQNEMIILGYNKKCNENCYITLIWKTKYRPYLILIIGWLDQFSDLDLLTGLSIYKKYRNLPWYGNTCMYTLCFSPCCHFQTHWPSVLIYDLNTNMHLKCENEHHNYRTSSHPKNLNNKFDYSSSQLAHLVVTIYVES